eukprot:3807398-Pyramimonas_sp.AAC.1
MATRCSAASGKDAEFTPSRIAAIGLNYGGPKLPDGLWVASWEPPVAIMGSSWAYFGRRLGSLMGCLGDISEASWAALGCRTPRQARTHYFFRNLYELDASVSYVARWVLLCHPARYWDALGPPGTFGGCLGDVSGPPWRPLGTI